MGFENQLERPMGFENQLESPMTCTSLKENKDNYHISNVNMVIVREHECDESPTLLLHPQISLLLNLITISLQFQYQISLQRQNMSEYLVTGGTGFIASYIIKSLLELGHTVRTTVRNPRNFPIL